MFDIGAGEFIVIAVIALLVVGPERLPQLAKQWVSLVQGIRAQATRAREDLRDSVGGDVAQVTEFLREADPRRILEESTGNAATVRPVRPPAPLWDADTP